MSFEHRPTGHWACRLLPLLLLGGPALSAGDTVTLDGSHVYQPTVSGTFESRDPPEVVAQAGSRNRPPIADAGTDPGDAQALSVVHLDGRGSRDPEGRRLLYQWNQLVDQSTAAVPLYRADTATPWFVPRQEGTYVFQLQVYDGRNVSDTPATVSIAVAAATETGLIADPGANAQDQLLGGAYRLDGSASRDTATGSSEGLRYSWKVLSAPYNRTGSMARVRLKHPRSAHPSFVPPIPGIYIFSLTVEKDGMRSAEKAVSVAVEGAITAVERPANEEVWTMGGNDPGIVAWKYTGIAPKRGFIVLLYTLRKKEGSLALPAGPCLRGCLLRRGVKAGDGEGREIRVAVSRARALAGYQARVTVCLPKIGRNDLLCNSSGEFSLEWP